MTRIYLIRHAEAEGNINRVFQGHNDGDVSENGTRQLLRLRERCRALPFDAVYSSPLRRAVRTAQAADFYHNLPIVIDEGLIEICGGSWEGGKWADFPTLYPEQNRLWVHEPWNFATEGGEPMRHVYDRMARVVEAIAAGNAGKTVCVVSHGCAIRNYLCYALGRPVEQLNSVPWCDNTAVSVIDYDGSCKPTVVLMNDASHLDEETTTLGKQDWWKEFEPGEGENQESEE